MFPLIGCNNTSNEVNIPVETSSSAAALEAQSSVTASQTNSNKRSNICSPLELAQKEYLAAYDNYVRLLRESGPQTIETLQALAEYQKKYQLYQMLLKADHSE
jgi:uncharacterized lipoprotein NlpE involved in copper resistance